MIVIDASLMVAWLLEESALALASDLNELLERERFVVPAHWPAEVGNALQTNLRRGRLLPNRLDALLNQCTAFDIAVMPAPQFGQIAQLVTFGAAQGLSLYDAAYVHMALDCSMLLATLDRQMRAASRRLGVRLFPTQDS